MGPVFWVISVQEAGQQLFFPYFCSARRRWRAGPVAVSRLVVAVEGLHRGVVALQLRSVVGVLSADVVVVAHVDGPDEAEVDADEDGGDEDDAGDEEDGQGPQVLDERPRRRGRHHSNRTGKKFKCIFRLVNLGKFSELALRFSSL